MTSDIWAACVGNNPPPYAPLGGLLHRLVESQEQIATMGLVDSLEEQWLLEQLIDGTKPAYATPVGGLHYLLSTPFRYPPLKYGSRFGSQFEPSLFYGSRAIPTVLAESAYYRFVFWDGMATPPPSGCYQTQHTLFGAEFETARGVRLHMPPFDDYQEVLTDKHNYSATQQLGQAMRETGVLAIEYRSARDALLGINVALYSLTVFTRQTPAFQEGYVCETTPSTVTLVSSEKQKHTFDRNTFVVDGAIPTPAT